jgi:hypothetical protein
MLGKFLSLFSFLDWIFSFLHDQKIRREIQMEGDLDLQKGKTIAVKVDAWNAKKTDEQVRKHLEKTGGYRDDEDL